MQELLDGYRETGVAYLDLSYFPTDALTEPGPAACVAGELKLVPGQFGMPSLVTCCPNPLFMRPSASRACQLHRLQMTHTLCVMSGLLHHAKPVGDERRFTHLHKAGLSSLPKTSTVAKAAAVHTDCRWCSHLQA